MRATIEREISAAMARARVPGVGLALVEEGQLAWARGFGVRSEAAPEAVDGETVFAVASLSKPAFAYLVLRLAARRLLDLDQPVASLDPRPYDAYGLDPQDERLARISVRQALCHSSGLGNWAPDDVGRVGFEPGTAWHYSGEGYLFLQRAVEQLTGVPLETLAERELFAPLGLERSGYVWRPEWTNAALGHGVSTTGGNRFPEAFSAFSLHATAADYARLVVAMMRDRRAEPMFAPAVGIDGELSWGLGFGLVGGLFWQWGDSGDFQSAVVGSHEERRALVCLTNSEHGLLVCSDVAALLLGEQCARPLREVLARGW